MYFKVRTINACGAVGPWSTEPVIYQKKNKGGNTYVWENVSARWSTQIKLR
jgi:hypothetical protein